MELILATEEDLKIHRDELISMMEHSLLVNCGVHATGGGIDTYEKLMDYFNLGKANVWLALDKNRVVGYAQFFRKSNERVHLNEIAVAKEYQGKGVGSALINAVEKSAKKCGAGYVELFCNEVNTRAKIFYGMHRYLPEKHLMIKAV